MIKMGARELFQEMVQRLGMAHGEAETSTVLMALNLQTSFLTPPFGFALFYLRGAAPEEIKTSQIWHGAIPFIGLQLMIILLVALVPELATWLPSIAAK